MRAAFALLLLIAGCDRLFGLTELPAPSADDARHVDSPPRLIDAPLDSNVDGATAAICTTTGVGCSGVLTAFVCDNVCFITCDENVTQSTAVTRCDNSGGAKLASLDTASVDACVTSHLSEFSWMGYVQFPASSLPSSNWYWLRGSTSSYTHWQLNEPNDAGGTEDDAEDCAYDDNSGGWNDSPCGNALAFICER